MLLPSELLNFNIKLIIVGGAPIENYWHYYFNGFFENALFGLVNKRNFFIAIGDHFIIFTLLGALHGLFA